MLQNFFCEVVAKVEATISSKSSAYAHVRLLPRPRRHSIQAEGKPIGVAHEPLKTRGGGSHNEFHCGVNHTQSQTRPVASPSALV
jgi:hypothetical protein